MFQLNMGCGMDLGFPDVCLTPVVVPVPIPYPDMAFSVTSAPAAYNVLIDCMPALNQLSEGLVSVGDEPGVLLGVVSHMESGEAEYLLGCFTIFVDGPPAQRLTSVTGQNAMGLLPNAPGICLVPSQFTVLTLG
ncbi:hypothetical protein Thiowin_01597 [Thiorhodovibrio winogradskyi]|uniref:Tox-PAAR-like domain-containing protein n=1 Tax=Thiorhodovibrio winogradskyi TaxID=77007 RepID=A0ABZ0SAP3_9GAMM|nr:DUF4150 domain-containing protein [Thiorhodovibrio winogradskyi]